MGGEIITCTKCGGGKQEADFYIDKRCPSGLRQPCKECTLKTQAIYRKRNFSYRSKKQAEYKSKLPKEVIQKYRTNHRKAYAQKHREYLKRWRRENPMADKAHRMVNRAVKDGVLIRPPHCQRCGKKGRIEGSHDDYSKPLNVEWLCSKCHRAKDGTAFGGKENHARA